MDNKITKRRLSNMLSYDWIFILVVVVVACVAWSLIYTMACVRLSAGQTFNIQYYYTVSASKSGELADDLEEKNVFSYDVIGGVGTEALDEKYGAQILQARASTHEGDVMVIDSKPVKDTVTVDGKETEVEVSNFMAFVDGYPMYDMEALLADAESYLARFYDGDTLIESEVEAHFNERMKKDNRYRKEEARTEGVQQEIGRIARLKEEAADFRRLLENHEGLFVTYARNTYRYYLGEASRDDIGQEKPYGLNLGYLAQNRGDKESISSMFWLSEDTSESPSAEHVVLTLYNYLEYQPDLQFEAISFLNYIVRTYSTLLD